METGCSKFALGSQDVKAEAIGGQEGATSASKHLKDDEGYQGDEEKRPGKANGLDEQRSRLRKKLKSRSQRGCLSRSSDSNSDEEPLESTKNLGDEGTGMAFQSAAILQRLLRPESLFDGPKAAAGQDSPTANGWDVKAEEQLRWDREQAPKRSLPDDHPGVKAEFGTVAKRQRALPAERTRKEPWMRRNIKKVIGDDQLQTMTRAAQAEEMERLQRLQEQRQKLMEQAFIEQLAAKRKELEERQKSLEQRLLGGDEVITISSSASTSGSGDDETNHHSKDRRAQLRKDSSPAEGAGLHPSHMVSDRSGKGGEDDDDDDDCKIVSEDEDEDVHDVDVVVDDHADDDDDDPYNSGAHVNDVLNVPDAQGRVLVNVGHPADEDDVFLAPHLARAVKPHQIGGIRFLYDNLIESHKRFKENQGFGCILAHAMGLGKSLQVVALCDILFRHTACRRVLCIVPVNTLQNWVAEFDQWLPATTDGASSSQNGHLSEARNFRVFLLNESFKNLDQRSKVILSWKEAGGVLMMGYELYRLLVASGQRKKANSRKKTKECNRAKVVDIEEESRKWDILEEVQKALVNPGPDLVVCDEGHRIKNESASTSQALKSIATRRRLVLTGYPLQNNLMEYWCMVDFVRPNYLGNKVEFSNRFERPIQNGQCVDSTPMDVRIMKHRAHVLHVQLKGFVQRRNHRVLRQALPPKKEHVILVRMTPVQQKLYSCFIDNILEKFESSNPLKAFAICCKIWNHPDVLLDFIKRTEVADDLDFEENQEKSGTPAGALAQQTTNPQQKYSPLIQPGLPENPVKAQDQPQVPLSGDGQKGYVSELDFEWAERLFLDYKAGREEHSNKLRIFLRLLDETVVCGDRMLLFSQSLLTLNLIEHFLVNRKVPGTDTAWAKDVNYFRLDGRTPAMERERLINAFNSVPPSKTLPKSANSPLLFLISTRAGSLGINLVGANRVVIFDASWNPCHDSQAVCRVYRFGQVKQCHIYRLVADGCLERRIYDRQINKQGMSDRVVDEKNPDAHLSSKDVHTPLCPQKEELVGKVDKVTGKNVPVRPEIFDPEDPVLARVVRRFRNEITTQPFSHESLLIDRKETKLSQKEKRLAVKSYEIEKNSLVSYKRTSYADFYPGAPLSFSQSNGSSSYISELNLQLARNSYSDYYSKSGTAIYKDYSEKLHAPKVGGPHQFDSLKRPDSFPTLKHPNFPAPYSSTRPASPEKGVLSSNGHGLAEMNGTSQPPASSAQSQPLSLDPEPLERLKPVSAPRPGAHQQTFSSVPSSSQFPFEALAKQGVQMQDLTVPRDMVIPTNTLGSPPIKIRAGEKVMLIKTPKGIYLKMNSSIIKIKLPQAVCDLLKSSEPSTPQPAPSSQSRGEISSVLDQKVKEQRCPNGKQQVENAVVNLVSSDDESAGPQKFFGNRKSKMS